MARSHGGVLTLMEVETHQSMVKCKVDTAAASCFFFCFFLCLDSRLSTTSVEQWVKDPGVHRGTALTELWGIWSSEPLCRDGAPIYSRPTMAPLQISTLVRPLISMSRSGGLYRLFLGCAWSDNYRPVGVGGCKLLFSHWE